MRRRNAPLKKLRRLAADPKVEVWSLDECHFQQHGTRAHMWVPPETKDPVLKHAPTRQSVACFGAVQCDSGKLVTAVSPTFDAVTFEAFLGQLLRHRGCGKRMLVVLDNAKYHHARRLAPFLHTHRRVLTLLFLPPYSPQLNPIERVWKLTRQLATHNRYFATLSELLCAVEERFALWRNPNRQLARLCGII